MINENAHTLCVLPVFLTGEILVVCRNMYTVTGWLFWLTFFIKKSKAVLLITGWDYLKNPAKICVREVWVCAWGGGGRYVTFLECQ